MKYRLGMLVAAMTLTVSTAFAQTVTSGPVSVASYAAMDAIRAADGVNIARDAWLAADQSACNAWSVWANPFAQWSKYSKKGGDAKLTSGNYFGYRANTYGIDLGVQRGFGSNLMVGLYTGFADTDFGSGIQGTDIFGWSLGLYGVYRWHDFFLSAKTSYEYGKYHFNPSDERYYGWTGKFDIGYVWKAFCDITVTPTVGLDYIWTRNDDSGYNSGTSRSGRSPMNGISSYRNTSLELPLMLTVAKKFATSFGSISPFVRGGWIHEFHNNATKVSDKVSAPFTNVDRTYKTAHDYGTVGLGLKADVNGRADLFAAWDYEWANRYYSNKLNLGMGINF